MPLLGVFHIIWVHCHFRQPNKKNLLQSWMVFLCGCHSAVMSDQCSNEAVCICLFPHNNNTIYWCVVLGDGDGHRNDKQCIMKCGMPIKIFSCFFFIHFFLVSLFILWWKKKKKQKEKKNWGTNSLRCNINRFFYIFPSATHHRFWEAGTHVIHALYSYQIFFFLHENQNNNDNVNYYYGINNWIPYFMRFLSGFRIYSCTRFGFALIFFFHRFMKKNEQR